MEYKEVLDKVVSLIVQYNLPMEQYYFLNDEQWKIQRDLIRTLSNNSEKKYTFVYHDENPPMYDAIGLWYAGVKFNYINTSKLPE